MGGSFFDSGLNSFLAEVLPPSLATVRECRRVICELWVSSYAPAILIHPERRRALYFNYGALALLALMFREIVLHHALLYSIFLHIAPMLLQFSLHTLTLLLYVASFLWHMIMDYKDPAIVFYTLYYPQFLLVLWLIQIGYVNFRNAFRLQNSHSF